MPAIRAYRPSDLDVLYAICLASGEAGADAAHLFSDPRLLGHVYAGPYGVLSPETVFVVEDGEGVCGYVVGPADTRAFAARAEAEWWPKLRSRYADPCGVPQASRSREERMRHLIHHPAVLPPHIVDNYPAHLHINLLPRLRGQGFGRRLIARWCETVAELGARGAHLVVGTRNANAVAFYRAIGFDEIERLARPIDAIVFGIATEKDAP